MSTTTDMAGSARSGTGDWRDEADRLRAEGLSIRAIAERVGMARGTVGEHFKPHYCACGSRRGHCNERCDTCRRADRRWFRDRRIELVAGMYNAGWLCREIAEALGRPVAGKSPMRAGQLVGPEIDAARKRGLIGYRNNGYASPASGASA